MIRLLDNAGSTIEKLGVNFGSGRFHQVSLWSTTWGTGASIVLQARPAGPAALTAWVTLVDSISNDAQAVGSDSNRLVFLSGTMDIRGLVVAGTGGSNFNVLIF